MPAKNAEQPLDARRRWERHESRLVRPFRSAEDYLGDTKLRLYEGGEFDAAPTLSIEKIERDRLALALQLSAPPEDLEELVGVPETELALMISLEDQVFKNTVVARREQVQEFKGGIIEVPDSIVNAVSWTGETRIHVSVVLAETRDAAAGLAQRAGSWLARKTFKVSRPRDSANFSITPVDDAYFKMRGLPTATTYLVEIQDTDLTQSCENMPDLVKVCMNQTVHAALARDEESPLAKALIRNIYVDVVSTIVSTGYSNLHGKPVPPDCILDVVAKRLSKATGVAQKRVGEFARENGGAQLRAVVQAEADLSKIVMTATARKAS